MVFNLLQNYASQQALKATGVVVVEPQVKGNEGALFCSSHIPAPADKGTF